MFLRPLKKKKEDLMEEEDSSFFFVQLPTKLPRPLREFQRRTHEDVEGASGTGNGTRKDGGEGIDGDGGGGRVVAKREIARAMMRRCAVVVIT